MTNEQKLIKLLQNIMGVKPVGFDEEFFKDTIDGTFYITCDELDVDGDTLLNHGQIKSFNS